MNLLILLFVSAELFKRCGNPVIVSSRVNLVFVSLFVCFFSALQLTVIRGVIF